MSMVTEISLHSYEKAGQHTYQDLGFYDRDAGNFPI